MAVNGAIEWSLTSNFRASIDVFVISVILYNNKWLLKLIWFYLWETERKCKSMSSESELDIEGNMGSERVVGAIANGVAIK